MYPIRRADMHQWAGRPESGRVRAVGAGYFLMGGAWFGARYLPIRRHIASLGMWMVGNPADDSLDALIFALVAGIAAALAVAGAELATTLSSTAKPASTPSAPIGVDSTTTMTQ